MKKYNSLTSEEAHVIIGKGTEAPYSSEYELHREKWVFLCRQCDAPLFTSEMKFDSWCGWPAFDDALPGRVKWTLDADGRRTEISCASCAGHLGHVFIGEKLTEKNTRHCVNGLSMKFMKNMKNIPSFQKAYFGGWCFWCMDAVFIRLEWVLEVRSGYMWGHTPYPTYARICSGMSGYIEIVEVAYDPSIVSYEVLLDVFFSSHDPTSRDRQWSDSWEQYRSIIFGSPEDIKRAGAHIAKLDVAKIFECPLVTELRAKEIFYIAEDYHQDYYANNPMNTYCSFVIDPKIAKLRESFAKYLKKK